MKIQHVVVAFDGKLVTVRPNSGVEVLPLVSSNATLYTAELEFLADLQELLAKYKHHSR